MMEFHFLQKIEAATRKRVELARELEIKPLLENFDRPTLDFTAALNQGSTLRVIAEIKRRSPSRGDIAPLLDPVEVAEGYARSGAVALSVLTEPDFFGGSLQALKSVRQALPKMPLLLKDFVIDELQIYQARHFGADAVLLICSLLGAAKLKVLYEKCLSLQMTPLIEVHDANELGAAYALGAKLIGINSRDLKTLMIDPSLCARLLDEVARPMGVTLIAESGLTTAAQMQDLVKKGFQGFLIGTELMRNQNPELRLSQLLQVQAQ